jgi:hypothetical protein
MRFRPATPTPRCESVSFALAQYSVQHDQAILVLTDHLEVQGARHLLADDDAFSVS